MTPILLEVVKETMTPLHQIYGWAVTEFLYYASYLVETSQKKLRELKKIKK